MIESRPPLPRTLSRGACWGALVALLGALGCSELDNCPDSQSPRVVTDGRSDPERLYYESKSWGENLDPFPAKSALWFEHGLGITPLDVRPFLSFTRNGTNNGDSGSVTPASGNPSLIDCVDSRYIVLRNDSCERDFHVRVVALGEGEDLEDGCGEPPR